MVLVGSYPVTACSDLTVLWAFYCSWLSLALFYRCVYKSCYFTGYIIFCRLFVCNIGLLQFEEKSVAQYYILSCAHGVLPGEFLSNYHKCWVTYVFCIVFYAELCGWFFFGKPTLCAIPILGLCILYLFSVCTAFY